MIFSNSKRVQEEIPPAAFEVSVARQAEIEVKVEVAEAVVVEPVAAEAVGGELEARTDQGVCKGGRG